MSAELDQLRDELIKSVVAAVRTELRRDDKALLTVPEVARKYRLRDEDVRRAAKEGIVKCRRTSRGGCEAFLICAIDAGRLWGAE